MIKAIVFDLDDTLYDDEATADATIAATATAFQDRHGINPEVFRRQLRTTAREIWYVSPMADYARTVGCSSWEGLWMQFYGVDNQAETMRQWLSAYRLQAWEQTLRQLKVDQALLVDEMARHFFEERRRRHTVYDDARPVLDSLRGRYALGLLTNGAVDLQQEKIDGSGLADYFDATVISGEIGIGKPDPAPFDLILKRLGVSVSETVMVGNSLGSDIAGARAVGMKSIWLNRASLPNDSETRPDAEVQTLGDIEPIVRDMR